MRTFKNILLVFGFLALLISGCTKDFEEVNTDPNQPEIAPTTTLMLTAQKFLLSDIRDEWFSGRMALTWSQLWAQVNYTEEDRYQYRENVNNTYWKLIYTDMKDLKEIIDLNSNEETKDLMSAYGSNDNQIAAAIVLKSWVFQVLTDTYGPIPYWSYSTQDNPDFMALQLEKGPEYLNPTYVAPEVIYEDLLKELKTASDMIEVDQVVFTEGDNIYGGDAVKWKKFANSLRLRVAMRIRNVPAYTNLANTHIDEAIDAGVFESNADNAEFMYEANATNSSPMYAAYFIENRTDFALSIQLVDLLKGESDVFNGMKDPRLMAYGAPIGTTRSAISGYAVSLPGGTDETNFTDLYKGHPYGVSNSVASGISYTTVSLPLAPLKIDYAEVIMDYAEVEFILSEYNGWDQTHYENGVTASMEKWMSYAPNAEVYQAAMDAYIAALPAASEENVITQKYIALYQQPYQAWAEYRRTGYPTTLTKPGEVTYTDADGEDYLFTPLAGAGTEIISRVNFSQEEELLNESGYDKGLELLGGVNNNNIDTKLFWDGR